MGANHARRLAGPAGLVAVPIGQKAENSGFSRAKALESLALLGRGVCDSPEARERVRKKTAILSSFDREIARVLEGHAEKYLSGHYREKDADGREQNRINILLTHAIYVSDCIRELHKKTLEMDDAGVSALFERTLDAARAFLSKDYFGSSLDSGVLRFKSLHPFLSASLRSCGMEGRDYGPSKTFESCRHETLGRIRQAIEAIDEY